MGVDTKFRTNKIESFPAVKITLEKSLGVPVEIDIDNDFNHCRFYFTFNGEKRTMWLFIRSVDSKLSPNPEFNNVFMLGLNETALKIMQIIAPYFGGWLKENECSDEPEIFIPALEELSNIPQTNAEKLYCKIAETTGIVDAEKVLAFIVENETLIKRLNFGKNV